jgi:NitT/TauT family transport system permease protein
MTTAAVNRSRLRSYAPAVAGVGTLVTFFLVVELLVQAGLISRFIVPPPSEIIGSFSRVIVEEHVFNRFLFTLGE